MDFKLLNEEGDTGTFIANGEWALLGMFIFILIGLILIIYASIFHHNKIFLIRFVHLNN